MGWEQQLLAFFDDLEQQASGLALANRESEVAELAVAEYATVSFASRLHASVGSRVSVRVAGGQLLVGDLARVGADWILLQGAALVPRPRCRPRTGPAAGDHGQMHVLPLGLLSSLRGRS